MGFFIIGGFFMMMCMNFKKVLWNLFFCISITFEVSCVVCAAQEETKKQQFKILYGNASANLTDSGRVSDCYERYVLGTYNAQFNRLMIRYGGRSYVLESCINDSYFSAAKDRRIDINSCRNGGIYLGGGYEVPEYDARGNRRDVQASGKPATTITMQEILFLYLKDAAHQESKKLGRVASQEDKEHLYNFQAAMMEILKSTKDKVQQKLAGKKTSNQEEDEIVDAMIKKEGPAAIDDKNLTDYVNSTIKFVKRLESYIYYCPQIDIKEFYHSKIYRDAAKRELFSVLDLLESSGNNQALIEAKQKNNALEIEKNTKRIAERQKEGLAKLCALLFGGKSSSAQKYIHSIDHTEIMLHVLIAANILIKPKDGMVIVSGKCPCVTCAAFITSGDETINKTFNESIMIGYNYGWGGNSLEKSTYSLDCKQLTSPVIKDFVDDNALSDIGTPPHPLYSPFRRHEKVTKGPEQSYPIYNHSMIKLYVVSPKYYSDAPIVNRGKVDCVISKVPCGPVNPDIKMLDEGTIEAGTRKSKAAKAIKK